MKLGKLPFKLFKKHIEIVSMKIQTTVSTARTLTPIKLHLPGDTKSFLTDPRPVPTNKVPK